MSDDSPDAEPDDDADADDTARARRHGNNWSAKISLPYVHFLARPYPDWWRELIPGRARRGHD